MKDNEGPTKQSMVWHAFQADVLLW